MTLDGDVPLVVELRPRVNVAAGEAGHSVGAVLGRSIPGTEELVLDGESPDVRLALGVRGNRRLVIRRSRRASSYEWMREAADSLVSSVPGSIVVEVGLPLWHPRSQGYVATRGGSRVELRGGRRRAGRSRLVTRSRLELELREQPDALARLLGAAGARTPRSWVRCSGGRT